MHAVHGDVGPAVGLVQYDVYLRHGGLGEGVEQLCAVADDAGLLLGDARQVARHVGEGDDGDAEGVAEAHEAGGLVAGIAVQHPGHVPRLVGDDAHRLAAQAGQADDDGLGEVGLQLHERAHVEYAGDDFGDVVALVAVLGHLEAEAGRVPVHVAVQPPIPAVGGDHADQPPDLHEALQLGVGADVGHAAVRAVHYRAAQGLAGDGLAGDGVDHLRAGDEHLADLLGHEDEVGDAGGVDRAAGAGAQDHRDLGDAAGGPGIAIEDVAVAGQRVDALLDARAAGVVYGDEGAFFAHGPVQAHGDVFAVLQAQRAALEGEVLGRDHHPLAGDLALADVDAVPVLGCGQFGVLVIVKEQLQPLLHEQLALFVLFFDEALVHFWRFPSVGHAVAADCRRYGLAGRVAAGCRRYGVVAWGGGRLPPLRSGGVRVAAAAPLRFSIFPAPPGSPAGSGRRPPSGSSHPTASFWPGRTVCGLGRIR